MNSARPNTAPSVAILFLHGIGGSARVWAPQIDSFARAGYLPAAVDLPGYGGRPAVASMDFAALAADVEDQVAHLGLDRPVVVGHSMGGMIAQTLVRRRPAGYCALVLSCTSPAFGDPTGDFQRAFLAARLGPLDAGKTMPEIAEDIVDTVMGPARDPHGRALAVESMAATPDVTYRAAVNCLLRFDERGNLGCIRVPVLCLAGEHDRNAPPPMMQRMADKIPGARYVCLRGVGHLPNLEAPRAFDAAVLAFLHTALAPGAAATEADDACR